MNGSTVSILISILGHTRVKAQKDTVLVCDVKIEQIVKNQY